jgi:hypothetical protein
MNQANELVVKVVRGAVGDSPDYSGNNPVRDFADENKDRCNNRSLQINVRADQLGELLDLPNQIVQLASRPAN